VGALGFGPADPMPPRRASCFDAAADTIAIGRETSRGWVIETSTAQGRWQRVIGPVATREALCPVLACRTAADRRKRESHVSANTRLRGDD
jgi:hypothetical protein